MPQAGSVLRGTDVGLDIADGAMASMSCLTSQPSLNAIVESLRFTPRQTGLDPAALIELSRYWEAVRAMYAPFETSLRAPSAEVYAYEMPGGQYLEPLPAGQGAGLGDALARGLQGVRRGQPPFRRHHQGHANLEGRRRHGTVHGRQQSDARRHARPRARAGVPRERGGAVRRAARAAPRRLPEGAPGAGLEGATREHRAARQEPPARRSRSCAEQATALLGRRATDRDALSLLLYPRVFPDLAAHEQSYSDTSILPTPIFFFGPDPLVENLIEIEQGKTLIVKLVAVGESHADGKRNVFFELNGQPRVVEVVDRSLASAVRESPKANPNDPNQIAAPLPGLVVGVAVNAGDAVRKGQKLLSIEAMKMETTLYAERPGRIAEVLTRVGHQVKTGELLINMTNA